MVSKAEDITHPINKYGVIQNSKIEIKALDHNILAVPDEYDTDYICGLFEKYRRVMVRAEYGGCGKSYACQYMVNLGHNVLIVCPTNRLCQNSKVAVSCTLSQFFAIGVNDEQKIRTFDDSSYDVIVV